MRLEELKERMLERVEDESEYLKEELEILQQETGALPYVLGIALFHCRVGAETM